MTIVGKICRDMNHYGIKRTVKGYGKKCRNLWLSKKYRFDHWHLQPMELRDYAWELAEAVNNLPESRQGGVCAEIGCGLGDIIGTLNWKGKKKGYDISQNVLLAARKIYPRVEFCKGSFYDLTGTVKMVVMVNFIHTIPEGELKRAVQYLITNCQVEVFVIDVLENIGNSSYRYSHRSEYMFGGKNYFLLNRKGPYPAEGGALRYVEFWKLILKP